ncbi:MAG: hypothetical protein QOJ89_2163 [bacterium]
MTTLRAARIPAAAAILILFVLGLQSAVGAADGLDYFLDASIPIDALARGDLRAYGANPALMGDFSLFLRAPFVRLVYDQNLTLVYLAGALPCIGALFALAMYLRRRMRALGRPETAVLLVALIAVFNPGAFRALHWGHPEEILAGVLCVGAIIAATRDRRLLAGLLLGLAVGTKQWAVIAIIPTLLAASEQRIRVLLVAGALAAVIALPSMLLAPHAVVSTNVSLVRAQAVATPPNLWWLISTPRSAAERESIPGLAAKIPTWAGTISHPLIVLLGIPLGWLYWRWRALLAPQDALGLFALLMLARCLLDPWNIDYYHAPFLLALLSWEALGRDGWPRLTLFAGAALTLTFPAGIDTMSEVSAQSLRYCVTYLAWALPLAAWLALALFAPQHLEHLQRRGRALRAHLTRRQTATVAVGRT